MLLLFNTFEWLASLETVEWLAALRERRADKLTKDEYDAATWSTRSWWTFSAALARAR